MDTNESQCSRKIMTHLVLDIERDKKNMRVVFKVNIKIWVGDGFIDVSWS
jgi:hypothetical protein